MAELRQTELSSPADAIAEYFRRVDQGEEIDAASFIAEHPELKVELGEFFNAARAIERMAGPTRSEEMQSAETSGSVPGSQSLTAVPAAPGSYGLPVPSEFGRYRILRVIGHGGMGAVYLAHDTKLQRDVAIKVPKFSRDAGQELIERFYREARAAAALRHPGICPVYDIGEIAGTRYISMAFIEGQPLSTWISQRRLLSPMTSAKLIRRVAAALAEAHARRVVHRDIKSSNIMINQNRRPVLMDFGLAQQIAVDDQASRLTHEGTILGTPAYMSPEQADGHIDAVGPASDIYSLGVVLYELLAGRVPFQGGVASVLAQIAHDDPVPPTELREGIEPHLESICLTMMAKRIPDRYADMNAVVAALTDYIKHPDSQLSLPSIVIDAPPDVSQALRRGGKQRWVQSTAIIFTALGLIAGLLLWNRIREDPPLAKEAAATSASPAAAADTSPDRPPLPEAERRQEEWARQLGVPVEYTNSIGMKLRLIPPGEFMLGSTQEEFDEVRATNPPDWELWRYELERPQQFVRISEPFFLGAHEVTVGQFREFVTRSGYRTYAERVGEGAERFLDGKTQRRPEWIWSHEALAPSDLHPVVALAMEDANAFCDWLSDREDVRYSVPSSAQWEYACRAGTTTRWHCGDHPGCLLDYAWTTLDAGEDDGPHPVGRKWPNDLGLLDMHGNVSEWVHSETRHSGWTDAARGGSHAFGPIRARSACIFMLPSTSTHADQGFRVAILGDLTGTADQ